jgi:hypothetical protein
MLGGDESLSRNNFAVVCLLCVDLDLQTVPGVWVRAATTRSGSTA